MIYKTSDEKLRQQVAFFALIATGIFIFYLLIDFLIPFLGAVIFHQVLKGFMWRLVDRYHWNKKLAAFAIILGSLVVIIIPTLYFIELLFNRLTIILNDSNSLINSLHLLDNRLQEIFGVEVISKENINELKVKVAGLVPDLISRIVMVVGQIIMMYFIMFFMLINYKEMPAYIIKILPMENSTIHLFLKELESMTKSNVIGAPVLAIAQGIVAIIIFWIFGAKEAVFWGSMCGIFSFVPFVGSALIWLPVGTFTILNGFQWQGIAILLSGVIIISNIDNIVRMYIQKHYANVHPLVTVLGVFAGIKLFQLPGLIIGPLLISYFLMGLKIYRMAYLEDKVDAIEP